MQPLIAECPSRELRRRERVIAACRPPLDDGYAFTALMQWLARDPLPPQRTCSSTEGGDCG